MATPTPSQTPGPPLKDNWAMQKAPLAIVLLTELILSPHSSNISPLVPKSGGMCRTTIISPKTADRPEMPSNINYVHWQLRESDCPIYGCEAKLVQNLMDAFTHVIACNDLESNKENIPIYFIPLASGVGASVSMLVEGTTQDTPSAKDASHFIIDSKKNGQ
ncbi:hypothetical protein VP01_2493g1 [Puccinia sorghi]|uniref:Uncharacterized protein n=1 Tax=Puccinia sorghi TaxID=27349 RepID=A0A0L6V5T1_9BASI|nr:hypothetical protein VP01_2493g1 [Puccinia sorghi]